MSNKTTGTSIQWKFIVQICIVLVTSSVILSAVITLNEKSTLKKMIASNGTNIAAYISKMSTEPLIANNILQLDSIVYNATRTENIVYAFISDSNGKILTTRYATLNYRSKELATQLAALPQDVAVGDLIKMINNELSVVAVSAPINIDMKTIGTVTLGMSTDIIKKRVIELSFFVITLNTCSALILGLSLFFITKKIILNPISKISAAAARLARGDLDVYVDINSSGEIQTLINSFNQMTEKLLNQTKWLEEEVKKRTDIINEQQMNLAHASKMSSLGEMAAGIAHEINNPLTIISMKCSVLKKYIAQNMPDAAVANKSIVEIENTVTRIAKIIRGLKNLSRDGSSEGFSPYKLRDLMEEVLGLCIENLKHNAIELFIDLKNPIYDEVIECRQIQLSQVFINLLGNAADAIQDLPERWIKIECRRLITGVEFRITDSGTGIPLEIQHKIFQPFFTTKPVGKGTGLGLSLSSSMVHDHHGTFSIDNDCPNTCFVITLPFNV